MLRKTGRDDGLQGYLPEDGLLHGGGLHLLAVQSLACVACIVWAAATTALIIVILRCCIPYR